MKVRNLYSMAVLALALFGMTGCAGKYASVTDNGFREPEQAISIPHPSELEKSENQYVTIFPVILDPGLWGVEGFSKNKLDIGIFPVMTDSDIKGYALITEQNDWADEAMQAIVVGRRDDVGRIFSLSRGGDTIHSIAGEEYEYDPERFKTDAKYKSEVISRVGMSVQEVESFWRKYSRERGVDIPPDFRFVEEIKVGSLRWEEFKAQLATRLTHSYKMPDGQYRRGYMLLDDFRQAASKNNAATPGQRFSRGVFVPAAADPVTLGIGTVGSFLNGLIAASNGPVEGFFAIAECRRGDLKPRFREMSNKFKRLLMKRDQIIYFQQKRIEELESKTKKSKEGNKS